MKHRIWSEGHLRGGCPQFGRLVRAGNLICEGIDVMNWVKWATLFWAVPALAAELPYAFNYGGVPSAHLEGESRVVSEDADRRVSTNVWTASDGLFRVVTRMVEYKRFGAVEYAPRLECVGTNATKIVDNFRSLSLRRMAPGAKVRALKGTTATERDFEAVHTTLGKDGTNVFSMVAFEGRSSAQWMPWWGIDYPEGDGVEIGIGWTGAWRADLNHANGEMTCSAGMTETHFRLLPGESLRQPSVLVFTRPKDVSPRAMQTRIHRFMIDEKSPRDAKGELLKPILPITAGGGNKTPEMMLKVLDWVKTNQMPFDCFWVDAGWNGPAHSPDLISNCGNMWYHFVGDWRFNPTVHPAGNLAQVADTAHANGLRMLLWVEPERCVSEPAPPVFKEHRDWLLPLKDSDIRNKRQLNVNLGNPAARAWVVETISRLVRESKLDVYRQDFNMNTLPLWKANDAPDRKGVTEMKYIDGLYAFWDELRHRFPHLAIENCASGGRRLDFEAVSRAHSYCRTDFAIGHGGPSQVTDVQNVLLNTLAYVPFQGSETTPARFFDDYGFFSSVAAGSVFTPSDWNAGIVKNAFTPEQTAWFKKVFDVANRMRPFFLGDYYPLVDIAPPPVPAKWYFKMTSLPDERRWCAYQMHRADLDAGFAVAFRRLDTPDPDFAAKLSGIDSAADYEVETYDGGATRMKGAELADWRVRLERLRDFRLIFYRKVSTSEPKLGRPCAGTSVGAIQPRIVGSVPGLVVSGNTMDSRVSAARQ